MNLGVRLKNRSFWYMLGAYIVTYIFAYYEMSGARLTTWSSAFEFLKGVIKNPEVLLPLVIGIFGHIVDFTTPGISDSERVLRNKKLGGGF